MGNGAAFPLIRLGTSCQERQLCCSVQGFDHSLTLQGGALALQQFGIAYRKRPPAFCVLCAPPAGVCPHATIQVVRDAGVEAAVGTFQDIDDPHHTSCGRGGAFLSLNATGRSRSRHDHSRKGGATRLLDGGAAAIQLRAYERSHEDGGRPRAGVDRCDLTAVA